MSWEVHDRLSAHMTATADCERAYRMGVADALAHARLDDEPNAALCASRAMASNKTPQNPVIPARDKPRCETMPSHGALD